MISQYIKSVSFIYSLVFLTFFTLVYLAYQQVWQYHLAVDIWGFYFPRFQYFTQHLSFESFTGNEYLPGAMLFFLLPGIIFIFLNQTWENYLLGLFLLNCLLILSHIFILRKISWYNPIIFTIIILSAGPIVLYRHELFVSLFLLIAIYSAIKNKLFLSSFTLGIATTIKIFPGFIFPYLFIVILKKYGKQKALKSFAVFILGALSLTIVYLLVGSLAEIKSALLINSIKPLHAESIWASFIEVIYKLTSGQWAPGKGSSGIFGIDPAYIILPLGFYNYFWILPLSIFYFLIYKIKKLDFNAEIPFLIILLFIIFSKIITPQYLLWPFFIFPLIKINKRHLFKNVVVVFLISICLLITQYLYPINYSQLLGIFFVNGKSEYLFYLLLLRNLLLILIFALSLSSLIFINEDNK